MLNRPENLAYQRLVEARRICDQEWPEPETTSLYSELRKGAGRIIYSVLGHREHNLSTEIATRALLHLRNYKGASQFSTWFYRLARNEAIRFVTEGVSREEQFSEDFEPEASERLPVFLPHTLPVEELQLLRLVVRGESFEVIAKILGCSKMAVSRRWTKLRVKLGELYGR